MNGPKTDVGHIILGEWKKHLPKVIRENGFYPLPMMVLSDRGFDVCNLELQDKQAMEVFLKAAGHQETKAAILGLDRFSNPEEDRLEFRDVLTCILYERPEFRLIESISPKELFSFGVIPYKFKPRVIRDINWQSFFWMSQLKLELSSFVPEKEVSLHR